MKPYLSHASYSSVPDFCSVFLQWPEWAAYVFFLCSWCNSLGNWVFLSDQVGFWLQRLVWLHRAANWRGGAGSCFLCPIPWLPSHLTLAGAGQGMVWVASLLQSPSCLLARNFVDPGRVQSHLILYRMHSQDLQNSILMCPGRGRTSSFRASKGAWSG